MTLRSVPTCVSSDETMGSPNGDAANQAYWPRRREEMEKTGDVVTRLSVAEEVGFEPTVPVDTAVLETARFGRSRTPPWTSLPWRSWMDLGHRLCPTVSCHG